MDLWTTLTVFLAVASAVFAYLGVRESLRLRVLKEERDRALWEEFDRAPKMVFLPGQPNFQLPIRRESEVQAPPSHQEWDQEP